jgi:hypothetical protein
MISQAVAGDAIRHVSARLRHGLAQMIVARAGLGRSDQLARKISFHAMRPSKSKTGSDLEVADSRQQACESDRALVYTFDVGQRVGHVGKIVSPSDCTSLQL